MKTTNQLTLHYDFTPHNLCICDFYSFRKTADVAAEWKHKEEKKREEVVEALKTLPELWRMALKMLFLSIVFSPLSLSLTVV